MTLLIDMFSPNISKLILRLYEVDDDRAVLYQFLNEEIPQRDVLWPRGVCASSGNMNCRRVVDEERSMPNPSLNPISCIMLLQETALLIVRAAATSSASIVDSPVRHLKSHFKTDWAIYEHDDVRGS